jgi:hypothetical protein
LRGGQELAQAVADNNALMFDITFPFGINWRQMFAINNSSTGGWVQTQVDLSGPVGVATTYTHPIDATAQADAAAAVTDFMNAVEGTYYELLIVMQGGAGAGEDPLALETWIDNIRLDNIVLGLPGDADGDGDVDADDAPIISQNYGQSLAGGASVGDHNFDNRVDLGDWDIFALNFGATTTPEGVAALPEPATLVLAALGGMAIIRRR